MGIQRRNSLKKRSHVCEFVYACIFFTVFIFSLEMTTQAESSTADAHISQSAQVVGVKKPNHINAAMKRFFPSSYADSIFEKKFNEPIEVKDDYFAAGAEASANTVKETKESDKKTDEDTTKEKPPLIEYQTGDVTKKKFLPPDQTPSVAVNPEAPTSVISMIESSRRGDTVTAKAYAKQFVRTLQNYFFEVKQIAGLIGDALIEEDVIKEEDWVGAEQAIDIELARTRLEKGVAIKPSHDVAMKRIVPDPKKEVEIYFFFSRSCSYCRFMAPDVERLYRAYKDDSRVKFTGLVVGDAYDEWLTEFRTYTGLSIPVYDGTDFSQKLKIGFLPVLLVVLPNGERSYYKSGQQSFERMYEFVRTAQGLPLEDSVKLQSIVKTPIGVGDTLLLSKNGQGVHAEHFSSESKKVNLPAHTKKNIEVDTF